MRAGRWLALGLVLLGATPATAVQIGALESRWDWKLRDLRFVGPSLLEQRTLRAAMLTKPRPWYAFWQSLPDFDPVGWEADVERLRQLYRSRGRYRAKVDYDLELEAEGSALTAVVYVDEDGQAVVTDVGLDLPPGAVSADEEAQLRKLLPEPDDAFTEPAYQRGEARLRAWFRERSYARVTVTRRARVDVAANTASVRYAVDPGPRCVFGPYQIRGTARVWPKVVRREIAFKPGEPFKPALLDMTRTNLAALNLFQSIRLDEDPSRGSEVRVTVAVVEAPHRDVRLGVGYEGAGTGTTGSEEGFRALASWRDYDFFGGARQLGVSARVSQIRQTLIADFLQPHFPIVRARTRLLALYQREDEEAYQVDRARGSPRLEWQPDPAVTAFAFYRYEYDRLHAVPTPVRAAVPDAVPSRAFLSGLGLGVDWTHTDDLVLPTRGWVALGSVEPVGGPFGGDVSFVRLSTEARGYVPLPLDLFGAARLRVGSAATYGGTRDLPLYERFYVGGTDSVRGYERRHVGPLVDDRPIGGKSALEASFELRRPITDTIDGVAFFDAGEVSLGSWSFGAGALQFGTGIGARYRSPVGPIRVDLGFPVDPPPRDAVWQIHVTVGPSF